MSTVDASTMFEQMLDSVEDAPVTAFHVGAFVVGCHSRHLGLASLARPPQPEHAISPVRDAGRLLPSSARELARRLFGGSVLESSIAVAALNGLLEPPADRCQSLNAAKLIARKGAGKRIAVVGHFPFVDRLREVAAHVDVFELEPGRRPGDLDAALLPAHLPEADVVAVTGTTLSNQTIGPILSAARPGAFVVLVGASAPLSPVLFDYGVDALCGARVLAPESAALALCQGGTFRQIPGVERTTLLRE